MKLSRKQKKQQKKTLQNQKNRGSLNTADQEIKAQKIEDKTVVIENPPEPIIESPQEPDHVCQDQHSEALPTFDRINPKFFYLTFLLFPLLAFAIYSNALDSNFVFDDEVNIELVPALKMTQLNWDSVVRAATEGFLKKRALANVTFAFNYYFGQFETRGYHLVNISIHALNGILVYLLFSSTFRTPVLQRKYGTGGFIPLAAAIIWLVHPLQIQSVTYIVQRMNSLATMFYLFGMLCYVKARMTTSVKVKWLLCTLAFFSALLGVPTKEIVASIPFAMLLFEFVFFQDFNLNWLKKNLKIVGIILLLFTALAFWYVGGNPLSKIFDPYDKLPYSAWQRVLTEFRVVLFYLKQLFLAHPSYLNILHDVPVSTSMLQPITTLISFLAIVGSVILSTFFSKKEPLIFFAVLWYFGTLVIESTVINLEIIYEHRSYLPSTFVILAVTTLTSRFIPYKIVKRSLFTALICLLCYWTYSRNAVWADEIAFWQDTIDKNPKASRAYNDLANAYAMKGEKKKAVNIYYQGMHLNYNDWKMHYNLGVILESLWETEKAIEQFNWVIRAKPKFAEAHFRLGMIYAREKKYQKAVWHTKESLRLDPSLSKARSNLVAYQKWAKTGRSIKK